EPVDLEVLRLVLDTHADRGIVDRTILDLDVGPAAFARAAHAERDLVVAQQATLQPHKHVLLEVQCGHVRDLTGLIPAMKVAVANDHHAPLAFGRSLRVDRIFARTFSLLEAGGVPGERPRPERAVLDEDLAL